MLLMNFLEAIRDFMETGGQVLWAIFATTLVLWIMILERFLYFRFNYKNDAAATQAQWLERKDRSSWGAHQIREQLLSKLQGQMQKNVSFIKTLVALCPLLGLLGTVTGMIAVFDVMAVTGTGNARLMASGISMATVPTMAGMVAALSGLYFGSLLEKKVKTEGEKLAEKLPFN